ncbi:norsolorinic acid reductase [Patellaria atrata CBS 101060]|uniref:Norsolorinic acid reductase n=1 Tax=Patellaria atrata CBS 101060 TaxID=1346257 RepID=A0A9P4SFY3_9PEZI|nr:norsolorinic acid reductase [Patellaria atrata CBS 101060]
MTTPLAPKPPSVLGRYRLLSPNAGVMVSPICLGAMNFGTNWTQIMGKCSKEDAFALMDYFYSQGGNFIDTAVNYQLGQSEQWIGEWMAKTPARRSEMVIATKYTGPFMLHKGQEIIQSNFGGNHTKAMKESVETSLRNLQTDYIDLYYIHVWTQTVSIPELMQSLNNLVASGKVLYLGVSDTPAWVVTKCNAYARQHGLRQFCVYQGRYAASERDMERDIIPMCIDEGMSIAPWGALGAGLFRPSNAGEKKEGRNMPTVATGKEKSVSAVLEKVAERKGGVPLTSVALAYVLHKAPYCFPICGGRKVEHMKGNIEALKLKLTKEDIEEIETGYDFNVGFPHNFFSGSKNQSWGPEDNIMLKRLGHFDFVKGPQPIPPYEEGSDEGKPQPPMWPTKKVDEK